MSLGVVCAFRGSSSSDVAAGVCLAVRRSSLTRTAFPRTTKYLYIPGALAVVVAVAMADRGRVLVFAAAATKHVLARRRDRVCGVAPHAGPTRR